MRFVFIPLFALILAVTSLFGFDAPDFGISYAIPDGFKISERNSAFKAWPQIYMVQASKTRPDSGYPFDLSIGALNVELTAMMIGAGDQMKGTYKKQIGPHAVVVLPGVPAPCGENAFFYIVPRADGTSVGIMAPRFLSKRGVSLKDRPPSGLDSIIEGLIATMKFDNNATNK